jgi:hypothetical protein
MGQTPQIINILIWTEWRILFCEKPRVGMIGLEGSSQDNKSKFSTRNKQATCFIASICIVVSLAGLLFIARIGAAKQFGNNHNPPHS